MKKTVLLFLFTILFVSSKAQTSVYHPFPDSNAVWNMLFSLTQNGCTKENIYSYTLNGDTLINGINYHQIYVPLTIRIDSNACCCTSGINVQGYQGAIRQDTNSRKVWLVSPSTVSEKLLYDFNLNIGDTIPDKGSCSNPDIVTLFDSVLIGGSYRKRWNNIIEGIGSTKGLLQPGCFFPFYLSCFTQNGITLYNSDSTVSCDIINALNDLSYKENIAIFPNPATEMTIISAHQLLTNKATLEIHNLLGEKVLQSKITDPKSEIQLDVSSFTQGVYFITLSDEERIYRVKMVKN